MNRSKMKTAMDPFWSEALEDLMQTSDAELRQEMLEDGVDIDELGESMKASMREVAAEYSRGRLISAKSLKQTHAQNGPLIKQPPVNRIKEMVQRLFNSNPGLGLAFREGKRQTDSDWQSLYDDLVSLGEIDPDDDSL